MAYAIVWEQYGAYVRYSDTVNFTEFMSVVLGIQADAQFASLKYVIHDMLQASALDFSAVDMTAIVAHELGARYTNPQVRPVVVSSDPQMEEKTRTFRTLTQLEVGFFSDLPAARHWLDSGA